MINEKLNALYEQNQGHEEYIKFLECKIEALYSVLKLITPSDITPLYERALYDLLQTKLPHLPSQHANDPLCEPRQPR